jgi:hypothetical protein
MGVMSRPSLSVEADIVAAKINADLAVLRRTFTDARGYVERAVATRNGLQLGEPKIDEQRAADQAEYEQLVAEQNEILAELADEMERVRHSAGVIQELASRLRV